MSECSIDKKDCGCSTGACNLTDWVIIYELAVIIVVLLLLYSELEKPADSKTKDNEN